MYPACHLVPEADGEQRRIKDVEAGSDPSEMLNRTFPVLKNGPSAFPS
jgi:hypothetical protein